MRDRVSGLAVAGASEYQRISARVKAGRAGTGVQDRTLGRPPIKATSSWHGCREPFGNVVHRHPETIVVLAGINGVHPI
jgi:hypothetical protein